MFVWLTVGCVGGILYLLVGAAAHAEGEHPGGVAWCVETSRRRPMWHVWRAKRRPRPSGRRRPTSAPVGCRRAHPNTFSCFTHSDTQSLCSGSIALHCDHWFSIKPVWNVVKFYYCGQGPIPQNYKY